MNELKKFKKKSDQISNVKIVGTSQFGLYFRFVKKTDLPKDIEFYHSNDTKFEINRSFVFDIKSFLNYIQTQQKNIPLCFYSPGNYYGREYYDSILFKNDIEFFLNSVYVDLQKNLYIHEFVCRIPIPLVQLAGFIGKINFITLSLYDEEKLKRNKEEKQWLNLEEQQWLNKAECDDILNKILRKKRKSYKKNREKCIISCGYKISEIAGKGRSKCVKKDNTNNTNIKNIIIKNNMEEWEL